MSRIVILASLSAFVLALPAASHAATLQVVSGTRGGTISFAQPIGQSFTAIDSNLTSFGFQFQSLNPGAANDPISFTLRQSEGLGGTILATRSFTLPVTINGRVPTWYDFDISGTIVTVGASYTAVLTTTSTRNAITFGPDFNIFTGQPLGGDAYLGGRLLATVDPDAAGYCNRTAMCDLSFRVTGSTPVGAVPEPATWGMMIAGLGIAGGALRCRRRGGGAAMPA